MKIGTFDISWEELKEADEGLLEKKKLHPCRDDQSLISWWYELEVTDIEALVIAVGDVLFQDENMQWEGFPAMTGERQTELILDRFNQIKANLAKYQGILENG